MIRRTLVVILALLPLLLLHRVIDNRVPAHRVFLNANVITMDVDDSRYQAVAVSSGNIQAVGSNDEIRRLIQPGTLVSDLQGATLLPGFIDAHSHFPSSGLQAVLVDLAPPPIGDTASIPVLLQRMRDYIKRKNPDADDWVIGYGYDDSSIAERRHPNRSELDTISTTRPVYVWHSSGHMGVANSRALELLGIDADTENPFGGVIVRDTKTGEPTGLLQETAAPSTSTILGNISYIDYLRIVRRAVDDYAASGITTAQTGGANLTMIRAMKVASLIRLLPFRLNVWPKHEALGSAIHSGEIEPQRYNDERFHIGPIKILADGSPQGRTAYLTRPYHTNPPDRPDARGFPAYSLEVLTQMVQHYHEAGMQMAIHGNGDAAIDDIISAFEHAQAQHPHIDPRLILVHAQMARTDQLERMQQLGITPSFFSNHVYYWGDAHFELHMGPERASNISPAASAERAGLRYSIHADTPVTPINPLRLINSAVERQSTGGRLLGENETVSVLAALRAVTIDAAWQMKQEATRGSIEPGKFADFVVLSGDPTTPQQNIIDLQIVETIVSGETIYHR
ncbi:hypothetical protein AB833_19980 [Chromatiales bacterium (ex Bugula neritina AB1)]|nr:hypothetical protein AB833_19980 [Chromatiales bacterium (ex Bugula neritina AB1)]